MNQITVSENHRTLIKNGKPFFYLADTCWSAFTNIRKNDWIEYLKKRKYQGFNTLQINVLAQWDRSVSDLKLLPFREDQNGKIDFSKPNEKYFAHAHDFAKIAYDYGFNLSLVVLWSNYVADTWASEMNRNLGNPENIFPQELLDPYFKKVIATFDEFNPIWIIGGDTDFITDKATNTYLKAFKYFDKHSPNTLKTIHVKGRFADIPESIQKYQDIFFYQSGHNKDGIDMPYKLADEFYNKDIKLPIINSEPCYEQMGYSRRIYGRFGQFDVRKAAWQSILSGACAGITYGAHGIWSWQESDSNYSTGMGEAFDTPMSWFEALTFPGATDFGFIKQFLELHNLSELIPAQNILIDAPSPIRAAISSNKKWILIYMPSNTSIKVNENLSNAEIHLLDLSNNHLFNPQITISENNTIFSVNNSKADSLIVIKK